MRALPITGEYPEDWKEISDRVWAEAGHRCIRCLHPYRKGEHGKGEWTRCDSNCRHSGPLGIFIPEDRELPGPARFEEIHNKVVVMQALRLGVPIFAQWRIGTVHHLDGNKANCRWWNLLALCQRCHLTIQSRVNPQQPYMLEHSDWFKPYVCGFYAQKYEGRTITRAEAVDDMVRLLALERIV